MQENLVIYFFSIWSIMKVYINCCMLGWILENSENSYFWNILKYESKRSWPMRLQDFQTAISPEQNDEKSWFFRCWYKFIEIKSWLKNIGVGMVINGCAHSGCRTQLAVAQEKINGLNWLLVCYCKFRKG